MTVLEEHGVYLGQAAKCDQDPSPISLSANFEKMLFFFCMANYIEIYVLNGVVELARCLGMYFRN